jgi:PTS system nitrogen regulatory IIA component
LQLLGELAQMFSNNTFREQLLTSQDPAAIHQMFVDWQG